MAQLSKELSERLRTAVRANDLRMRNWSSEGQWLFAIYTADDSYVGTVTLSQGTLHVVEPGRGSFGLSKRERTTLRDLAATFNVIRGK